MHIQLSTELIENEIQSQKEENHLITSKITRNDERYTISVAKQRRRSHTNRCVDTDRSIMTIAEPK